MLTNEDKIAISLIIDNLQETLENNITFKIGRLTYRFHEFEKHTQKTLRQLDQTHSECHRDYLSFTANIFQRLDQIDQRLNQIQGPST